METIKAVGLLLAYVWAGRTFALLLRRQGKSKTMAALGALCLCWLGPAGLAMLYTACFLRPVNGWADVVVSVLLGGLGAVVLLAIYGLPLENRANSGAGQKPSDEVAVPAPAAGGSPNLALSRNAQKRRAKALAVEASKREAVDSPALTRKERGRLIGDMQRSAGIARSLASAKGTKNEALPPEKVWYEVLEDLGADQAVDGAVEFRYRDRDGGVSRRRVDLRTASDDHFVGFCHLRQDERTFRFDRITGKVTLMDTGEIVDVDHWKAAVLLG